MELDETETASGKDGLGSGGGERAVGGGSPGGGPGSGPGSGSGSGPDGGSSGGDNTLHVILLSDSLGDTAATIVTAVLSQFSGSKTMINRLSKATSMEQVSAFLESLGPLTGTEVVFFTMTNPDMRDALSAYLSANGIAGVDLLGPSIDAISRATGRSPALKPGVNHRLDEAYFRRIEAMDYAVDHDDGRLPEEYCNADIVLIGVSRSSKTPLSIYLASAGYKVANLPLVVGVDPPRQIFEIEPWRVFGLMSSPEVLARVRSKRLGEIDPKIVENYAGRDYVTKDLEDARAMMRRIGCIVIRTDNRAIEETAHEILDYYHAALALHGLGRRERL